jgi:hypothetical protein
VSKRLASPKHARRAAEMKRKTIGPVYQSPDHRYIVWEPEERLSPELTERVNRMTNTTPCYDFSVCRDTGGEYERLYSAATLELAIAWIEEQQK